MRLTPLAFGAHPLVTQDPDTQGDDHHQIEINTDWGRQDDSSKRIASLNCMHGTAEKLDVFAPMPFTLTAPSDINHLSVSVKWRCHQSSALGFALKLELVCRLATSKKRCETSHPGIRLTTVAAYDAAPWRLLGNIAIAVIDCKPIVIRTAAWCGAAPHLPSIYLTRNGNCWAISESSAMSTQAPAIIHTSSCWVCFIRPIRNWISMPV